MGYLESYNASHRNRINRLLHSIGIPAIVVSLPLFFFHVWWGAALFVGGWALQFLGHYFEGKPPAFFSDPLYLIVGPYWWLKKMLTKKKR
ncbi:MAG: DUF962 domain-containing protein [Bdellovibrionota bacterium]